MRRKLILEVLSPLRRNLTCHIHFSATVKSFSKTTLPRMITQHERLLLSRSNQPFIAHGGHTQCAVWGRMTNKTIGLTLNTT